MCAQRDPGACGGEPGTRQAAASAPEVAEGVEDAEDVAELGGAVFLGMGDRDHEAGAGQGAAGQGGIPIGQSATVGVAVEQLLVGLLDERGILEIAPRR